MDGWVLSTLPRAIAFAAGLVKDREVAEDLVHDCYCRLLAKAGDYDLQQDGTRLLFRSITNACIDRSRKKSTVSLYEADEDGGPGRMRDLTDRRAYEPWQLADHGELQRAISAGLEKLTVVQRAALELKTLGQSLQDIADALDVTPTNAGVLIHRARQALSKHIAEYVEA
ncbi:RNA polymerase sigma factor [Humisphaera borealis]|uniref:RNA polymerase sigma factor n=1 Tax=Humisphaera borealis TaxID=2807512 RepID=UPI0021BCCF2D|nr:sigma-70 family RNA polymerase sigma factor [Humisphaera borealis]